MHHCDLVRGGGGSPTTAPCAGVTPTADFIRKELTDAGAILEQLSGQKPVPYWRPPYGVMNAGGPQCGGIGRLHQDLHLGYRHDRLEADRRRRAHRGQIATKVVGRSVNGSVVLMHLGGYETLDAAEAHGPQASSARLHPDLDLGPARRPLVQPSLQRLAEELDCGVDRRRIDHQRRAEAERRLADFEDQQAAFERGALARSAA